LKSIKEQINENYSLENKFNNISKQTPVPLITMLNNFAKSGNFYLLENRVDSNQIKTTNFVIY